MPLETVRIDSAVATPTAQPRPPVTLHWAGINGQSQTPECGSDHPHIATGMTITAYLKEPGNWQTLVAWRDHGSGEVVCEPEAGWFYCISAVIALCFIAPSFSHQPGKLAGASLMPLALFCLGVRNIWFLRSVRRRLLQEPGTAVEEREMQRAKLATEHG